jgi:quinol monooxygenase YgiN
MNPPRLVRIVRLSLHPDRLEAFLQLFDEASQQIRAVDGCEYLELLQDASFPNIVSTYSHWRDESALDVYRASELFRTTWSKTKSFFIAPPEAFSYHTVRTLP